MVSGDTLWDLDERFYGDPFKYHLIAAANDIVNPDAIFPDQVLVIPGLSGQPGPTPDHPRGSRPVAVTEDAHIIIRFGVQNLYEEATFTGAPEPTVTRTRAADDSRVVFELPKGTELPFTVSGVLGALSTLGLRVPPLAVPRLKDGQRRPPEATVPPAVPAPDQTAIEAPYRLIVSPDSTGGVTHPIDAATAPGDSTRVLGFGMITHGGGRRKRCPPGGIARWNDPWVTGRRQ
ncbi:LysM peptidoglycan-binding domain-containing protein [Nocardia sp. NBC_00403]|uniref:LysM peptidoglycan-binding domain-containing protein n=1 Tax=Nocardia sp. NBC_00403 TaxID=2975990 RepID=UPI003FA59866